MRSRLCSVCRLVPPDHANGYCRPCNRAYGKRNYALNKERYYAQAKKRDQQLDALILKFKDKPCTDCKIKYPPYVMDFDHLGEEPKILGISHMRRRRMAFEKILAEIAKCEVVCSNCHRIRTNTRNPARYTKIMEAI